MKIAIIGAGAVGQALGIGWSRSGHEIVYGLRNPEDPRHRPTAEAAGGAALAYIPDACREADAIVLAVQWSAVRDALAACGELAGRLIIDVTNPLVYAPGGIELAIGFSTSAAEEIAALAPGAHVVKAMNQVGAEVMAAATGYPVPPVMFVAGDHPEDKARVIGLVGALGFDARDAGPLKSARLLEPFAMLWIDQVIAHGAPRSSAFALMARA